jgi:hypothetical protein
VMGPGRAAKHFTMIALGPSSPPFGSPRRLMVRPHVPAVQEPSRAGRRAPAQG